MFLFLSHSSAQIKDSAYCNYKSVLSGYNLGLFGGSIVDLEISPSGNVFAAVKSPQSLFISTDTGNTWNMAFSQDSLIFDCGNRGWGGGATKVYSNQNGWVAALINESENKLTSSVISLNNGVNGSWQTAVDESILSQKGFTPYRINDIILTDSLLYTAAGKYLLMTINPPDLIDYYDITSKITSLNPDAKILKVSVPNNDNNLPYYLLIQNGSSDTSEVLLYQYDGNYFNKITTPNTINKLSNIHIHPNQKNSDTIFINGTDSSGVYARIFRSYDQGTNWTDITYSSATFKLLNEVEYVKEFASLYPNSNGGILLIKGEAYSADMGNNWITYGSGTTTAIYPDSSHIILSSINGLGMYISNNKFSGLFEKRNNFGLEAVQINQISLSSNKNQLYAATNSGLAYTKFYNDTTTLLDDDRWKLPYGQFPVINITDQLISAVKINPNDTNHVIAGGNENIYFTKTGPSAFLQSTLVGLSLTDVIISDIEIIDSNIVIAVTSGADYLTTGHGQIIRSTDGGKSWIDVSPSGFNNGNTIEAGLDSLNNTIVFVGSGLTKANYGDSISPDPGVLWRSDDLGVNWVKVNDGPQSNVDSTIKSLPVTDIKCKNGKTDTIFLSGGYKLDNALVVSYDYGTTYNYKDLNLLGAINFMAFNEFNSDTLYISAFEKLILYRLLNDSSYIIYQGLPGENIPSVQIGSILAGTTTGFYLIDLEVIIDINTYISGNLKEIIKLYPNPGSGNEIYCKIYDEIEYIELWDAQGRNCSHLVSYNNSGNTCIIKLSPNMNPGIYMLSLHTSNDAFKHGKIIKLND
jgi:photosystem II stability/assembly factor-like uncharacterized protein